MLTATKRKAAYILLAVTAFLLLASTPVVVPAVFAGECPGGGNATSC